MLLLGNNIVDGRLAFEAAAWRVARWVRGEEDECENDERNDDAATVGHPSL